MLLFLSSIYSHSSYGADDKGDEKRTQERAQCRNTGGVQLFWVSSCVGLSAKYRPLFFLFGFCLVFVVRIANRCLGGVGRTKYLRSHVYGEIV